MNAFDLMNALRDVPEDLIDICLDDIQTENAKPIMNDTANHATPIVTSQSLSAEPTKQSGAHSPVFAGIAVAVCLIFAVGFFVFLFQRSHDDLSVQNEREDSMILEITTASGTRLPEAVKTTEKHTTVSYTDTTGTSTEAVNAAETDLIVYSITTESDATLSILSTTDTITQEIRTELTTLTTTAESTAITTTKVVVPHMIMSMTLEEVEHEGEIREGPVMFGSYERRIAQLKGLLAEDAKRISVDEVRQMLNSGMCFDEVLKAIYEQYPYPDYIGGSGLTLIEYWLDDSGNDYILVAVESESIDHIIHNDDGSDIYDAIT